MKKTKKILYSLFIILVFLSNVSYAISDTICEMTKNSACPCLMSEDDNTITPGESVSSQNNSCCKTEVKYISNSSYFENTQKDIFKSFFSVKVFTDLFHISTQVSSNIRDKEVLLFYNLPIDIPVKNSSLLI